MAPQKLAGLDHGPPDPVRQGALLHPIIEAQHYGLEPVALETVRGLGRVLGDGPSLLGKCEIRIARAVAVHEQRIAGKRRGDPNLLARPVDIGEPMPGRRFDKAP